MLLTKLIVTASWLLTVQASTMKWSIDWNSDSNLLSGSYLSKELLQRIIKLDAILQQKITQLDDEINTNFHILMAITSLMSVVLVMVLNNCYRACKEKVDTAIKPDVSRVPVLQDQNVPARHEQHIVDLRHQMIRQPLMRETSKIATAPAKNMDKETYIEMKTPEFVQCQYN